MGRSTKVLGFSVPFEIAKEYEDLAKTERKTKSELFREMVRLYKEQKEEKEFRRLQRYGTLQAKKKKILTEEDVERIVFEDR